MSYQVIARKWRPKTFDEVVGQDHIIQTLKNAIATDRIAHAYLFAGSRGVGKTSTARIFSRALNCQAGPSPNPCNKCDLCVEISDSRSLDVIEIDGASNNSVEEVRELRENAKYSPARTKYKIYIIDEVHMLSKSAFNALLKILEEPPDHLIFIFATTELHKIPDTVLSRCQYFEFKPISSGDMVRQLDLIAKKEGLEISLASLKKIARSSEGSLRDAEGLLDQSVSFSGKSISDEQIASILGVVGQEIVSGLVDAIIARDTEKTLTLYQEVAQKGSDTRLFCRELLEYFRNLTIVKLTNDLKGLIDASREEAATLKKQAEGIGVEEIQYLFNTLLKIDYDLKSSPVPSMVMEMALIRMSRYQPVRLIEEILERLHVDSSSTENSRPPLVGRLAERPVAAPVDETKRFRYAKEMNEAENQPTTSSSPSPSADGGAWERIVAIIKSRKSTLKYMMDHARLIRLDESMLIVEVDNKMAFEILSDQETVKIIHDAVLESLGSKRMIKIEMAGHRVKNSAAPVEKTRGAAAKKNTMPPAIESDIRNPKIIRDALEIFGGTIIKT